MKLPAEQLEKMKERCFFNLAAEGKGEKQDLGNRIRWSTICFPEKKMSLKTLLTCKSNDLRTRGHCPSRISMFPAYEARQVGQTSLLS